MHPIKKILNQIQRYMEKPWYPVLVATVVGLDVFLLAVPNDILLISAVMAKPKRWLLTCLTICMGSTLGAALLCALLYWNPDAVRATFPGLFQSHAWQHISDFLHHYGLLATFLGALGPFPQQPFIILGALSDLPFVLLIASLFIGRLIKYLIIGALCSHAPGLLKRFYPRSE